MYNIALRNTMAVTINSLPAPVQQDFALKLLAVPTPDMIHKIPAMKDKIRRNSGPIKRYRRYNPLNASLVPLGPNGVTPPSTDLTAIDIDARIDWYGQWIGINEQVVLNNQEAVLNEASIRLGVALRQTEDQLTANMLASTAAQVNCVNGSNGDNPTEITLSDVKNVVRSLVNNNGKQFLTSMEGEDKFGTAPIRSAYFALCSSQMISDLENIDTFIEKSKYPNQGRVLDAEWGSVSNLRFLVSSIGSVSPNASGNNADVYNIFCVAQEAYACIEQDGASTKFIYLPAQFSGPLALNVTVGYKFAEVPRLLNDAWAINLRATLA